MTHIRTLPFVVALAASALTACGSSMDRLSTDWEASEDTAAGPSDDLDADPDAVAPFEAVLTAFDGDLVVTEGNVDADQSALSMTVYAEDHSACTIALTVTDSVLQSDPIDDVDAASWWTLSLTRHEDASPDCWSHIPPTLDLAAVAYDSQLQPAADAAGFTEAAPSVYGAVLRYGPTEPAFLFGLLDSEALRAEDAPVNTTMPVADGDYTLTTLYLLPLPPQE